MECPSLSAELNNIACLLAEALDAISAECNVFLKKLPQTLSFDSATKSEEPAELITAYYLHTAAICRIVERQADPHLISISELMHAADQTMQSDLVVKCDALIERFLELRTVLNEYLRKNNETRQPDTKIIFPTQIKQDTLELVHHINVLTAYLRSFAEPPDGKRNHL